MIRIKTFATCFALSAMISMWTVSAQTNTFPSSGNVGIGTTSPGTLLHIVSGSASASDNSLKLAAPNLGSKTSHIHYGLKGHWYIRSADSTGNVIIQDTGGNVGVGTSAPNARFEVYTATTNSGDNTMRLRAPNLGPHQSHIHFGLLGDWYIRSASSSGKIVLQDTGGKVGIGTSSPDHKLDVKGTIRAEEVIVETGWSDFVFDEGYAVPTLGEVEEHIEAHGHLADVPSAEVVESEGLSLGDAQKVMMQKIEELTLYMIEQDRRSEILESRIVELEKENEILKSRRLLD